MTGEVFNDQNETSKNTSIQITLFRGENVLLSTCTCDMWLPFASVPLFLHI